MKKHFISLLALLLVTQICSANVITGVAAIPDGYYSGVDGKSSAESILDALFAKIKNHTVISYKSLEPYYEETDFYSDTVWDMYSTCRFTMDEANKSQSAVCDGWNKEHSIPQSWFNEGSPMKSDLFHVYPTDARVNNFRSNNPYGEVNGPRGTGITNKGESSIAPHALGKVGTNTFPGYSGTVYEPEDEYKGDFARTYFYMCARYRDQALNASEGSAVFTSNKTNLTTYAKNLFLKWHRNDPVSQKEIDRNQAVYGIQKNRNPFIDYPDLAEYIWGDKVGQQIDLSSLTPTCEGGGQTPIVVIKHGVTWSINGEDLRVDSVKENTKPSSAPVEPTSCSSESTEFMGWTTTAIEGTQDDAPAVLYATLTDIPAVTTDVTYYAVFAKAETDGEITTAVYTYNKDNTEGWTNTATWTNNSYWLLATGTKITSPSVNLAGLTSITVTIRTYGGTSYNQLDVKANGAQIATIEAAGKSLADQTWTNTQSLTGTAPIEFSSSYGSDKGIGISAITINATGANVTYNRYITSCQIPAEIESVLDNTAPRKVLIGGQIYIQIGERLYTITGQCVK